MLVDVSSILKEIGGKVSVCGEINTKDTDFLGESFHFHSLSVDGDFTNNGKSLILRAKAIAEVDVCCARCRKPLVEKLEFYIDETFMQGTESTDDEDIYVFDGHEIEIDEVVYNNFFMNASGKYLCSEDCRGICPECGANLNDGDCGCNHEVLDPRWEAILSKLNDTDKN